MDWIKAGNVRIADAKMTGTTLPAINFNGMDDLYVPEYESLDNFLLYTIGIFFSHPFSQYVNINSKNIPAAARQQITIATGSVLPLFETDQTTPASDRYWATIPTNNKREMPFPKKYSVIKYPKNIVIPTPAVIHNAASNTLYQVYGTNRPCLP